MAKTEAVEATATPEPGKPCEGCKYFRDYQNVMRELADISKEFRRILQAEKVKA